MESSCLSLSGMFRTQITGAARMGQTIRFTVSISITRCGSRRWSSPSRHEVDRAAKRLRICAELVI
jgi:hypothetical protein